MEITKLDESTTRALYQRYQGQTRPQDVYVQIDWEEKKISTDWNGEIGNSVPFSVWHGRVDQFSLPAGILPTEANQIMEEIEPIAEKLSALFTCEWDGSNHVGRWTSEGKDKLQDLADKIEVLGHDARCVQVWDAGEYFQSDNTATDFAQTLDWSDNAKATEHFEKWIEENTEDDAGEGPITLENVDNFVTQIREQIEEAS